MIKTLKIITLSVLGLGVVIASTGYFVIKPKEDRKECASRAISYVKERSENARLYPSETRDDDYRFMFEYCLNSKGYE